MNVTNHQYSDNITGKKIVIIGPNPPPLGGISVHVQRVAEKLKIQGNSVAIFNPEHHRSPIKRFAHFGAFLIQNRPEIIFYHTLYHGPTAWLMLLASKIFLRFKIIVIDHDNRYWYTSSKIFKKIIRVTMCFVEKQILIGDTTYKSYRENHISITKSSSVESPFLAPNQNDAAKIFATYPATLTNFIITHSPRIIANASRLTLLQGKDLYGLDTCVKLVHELKREYPQIGLIFALGVIEDHMYWESVQKKIKNIGLEENIFFLREQKELWPLCAKAHLFLRPTLSDSYGISIAEALAVGTPAIASDVCMRPAGTILYDVNNFEDLKKRTQQVFNKNLLCS